LQARLRWFDTSEDAVCTTHPYTCHAAGNAAALVSSGTEGRQDATGFFAETLKAPNRRLSCCRFGGHPS
jgi:hypothetical protein